MFIVFLRFSQNKSQAGQFMAEHNEWIKQGLVDDVFLLVGSLQPNQGGAILAHHTSLTELQRRVEMDPFVREQVVLTEIMEITPGLASPQLKFLIS